MPTATTATATDASSGVIEVDGATVRLSAPESAMDALVKALARHHIVDLVSQPADLDEIFLEMYREANDGS